MQYAALVAVSLAVLGMYISKQKPATGTAASPASLPQAIGGFMQNLIGTDAPRGIRNHNPLNIREGENDNTKWQGEHDLDLDAAFEEFVSPFYGIRAAARTLKTYRDKHNRKTVREIISRWAPKNENDVEGYVDSVVKRSGLFPDLYLSESDYPALVAAMIYHENGQQPYDMALIQQATAAGFA